MPQLEVLILERSRAVYGGDPCAVVVDEIPALNHEVLDDAVEGCSLVPLRDSVSPVLPGAKLPEVLCCLWTNICKEDVVLKFVYIKYVLGMILSFVLFK